jgi:RNA-binding protein
MPVKKSKKELVKMGSEIDPTVHIGKEGLTEGIVQETKAQLKKAKLIKVRVLPSAGEDKNDLAQELADRAGAHLVETRGFTALLCEASLFDRKGH